MNRELIKILLVLVAVLTTLLASAFIGWQVRGLKCSADLADFQSSLAQQAQEQRTEARQVEVKQDVATGQSSQRIDIHQAIQQKEIVYVDKQVIKYRDRWRDRECKHLDDWVSIYNASLFGNDPAMPEAGETGSAPDSATLLLPAGRN